jgi:hypothetical protein
MALALGMYDTNIMQPCCCDAFEVAPALQTVDLGLNVFPTSFKLPCTRRLVNFRISPESNHGSFFDCLTLPALHAVCLDPQKTSRSNSWPGQQVLNLLQRSLCTLEKFTWGLDSVKIENIIRCLESMPDLKELQIMPALRYSLPELLQSLTLGAPDEAETRLCPKLRAVQLSIDHSFDVGALSAFIRSCRNIETVRDRTD